MNESLTTRKGIHRYTIITWVGAAFVMIAVALMIDGQMTAHVARKGVSVECVYDKLKADRYILYQRDRIAILSRGVKAHPITLAERELRDLARVDSDYIAWFSLHRNAPGCVL